MHNPDGQITNRAPSGPSWGRERQPSTWLHLSCCHGATLSLKTFDSVRNTSAQGDIYRLIVFIYIYRERERQWKRGGVCHRREEEEDRVSSTERERDGGREREHRNTRMKSIRSQYTVDMQYVTHQNSPSPKCHLFSHAEDDHAHHPPPDINVIR